MHEVEMLLLTNISPYVVDRLCTNSHTKQIFQIKKTSRLSALLASTPVKNKSSEDIPGKTFQRGSSVISSSSPVDVKFRHIIVFLLFSGGKWSQSFPAETGALARDVKNM